MPKPRGVFLFARDRAQKAVHMAFAPQAAAASRKTILKAR
jgi:hypothetical protein